MKKYTTPQSPLKRQGIKTHGLKESLDIYIDELKMNHLLEQKIKEEITDFRANAHSISRPHANHAEFSVSEAQRLDDTIKRIETLENKQAEMYDSREHSSTSCKT